MQCRISDVRSFAWGIVILQINSESLQLTACAAPRRRLISNYYRVH